MTLRKRTQLQVESLETRWVPATFNMLMPGNNSLTLTQTTPLTGADNLLEIDDTGTLLTVTDSGVGGTTRSFNITGIANITINLFSSDTGAVEYDLTAARSGSLTINLNNVGSRSFGLNDDAGEIGTISGGLTINDGGGDTSVSIGGGGSVIVGGNVDINLGLGADSVAITNSASITGGNLTIKGAESTTLTAPIVGGNTTIDNFGDINPAAFTATGTFIGGSFNYRDSSGADSITFTGASVGGFTNINLMTQVGASSVSVVNVVSGSALNGGLSLMGGSLGAVNFTLDDTSAIHGPSINMFMMGGTNTINLDGLITGFSVTYNSFGGGTDFFNFSPAAGSAPVFLNVNLGAGNDTMVLDATDAAPRFAMINLGAGADSFPPILGIPFFPVRTIDF
ncbi:MAG: hypothetical protein ACFCD0_00935 [Gemmataceae bacterium]